MAPPIASAAMLILHPPSQDNFYPAPLNMQYTVPSSVYGLIPPNDPATPDLSLESTGQYASLDYFLSASLPDPSTSEPFNLSGATGLPSPYYSPSEAFVIPTDLNAFLSSPDFVLMERELDGRGMRQFNERVLGGLDPVEDEEEDEEGSATTTGVLCLGSTCWKSLWKSLWKD